MATYLETVGPSRQNGGKTTTYDSLKITLSIHDARLIVAKSDVIVASTQINIECYGAMHVNELSVAVPTIMYAVKSKVSRLDQKCWDTERSSDATTQSEPLLPHTAT